MGLKKRGKQLTFLFLKTLNPRYYRELAEKEFTTSIKYFFIILLTAFFLMSVLAIPKLITLKSDIESSVLNINNLKINANFDTIKPISLPRDNPLITLDTTNNKTMDTEIFLLTNEKLYYNISGRYKEITLGEYDLTHDKEGARKTITLITLLLLPSFLLFYYLAYLIKYLLIIIPFALISLLFTRMTKNKVSFKQAIALSLYTSTAMIFIEILTIPFFIKDYIFTYSPFLGINFSAIAITAYLTLYVTSIRISGNPELKHD